MARGGAPLRSDAAVTISALRAGDQRASPDRQGKSSGRARRPDQPRRPRSLLPWPYATFHGLRTHQAPAPTGCHHALLVGDKAAIGAAAVIAVGIERTMDGRSQWSWETQRERPARKMRATNDKPSVSFKSPESVSLTQRRRNCLVPAFAVIRDAMKDKDRVVLAKIVIVQREHIGAADTFRPLLMGTRQS